MGLFCISSVGLSLDKLAMELFLLKELALSHALIFSLLWAIEVWKDIYWVLSTVCSLGLRMIAVCLIIFSSGPRSKWQRHRWPHQRRHVKKRPQNPTVQVEEAHAESPKHTLDQKLPREVVHVLVHVPHHVEHLAQFLLLHMNTKNKARQMKTMNWGGYWKSREVVDQNSLSL